MPTVEHNGKSFQVDEDGFLLKGMEEWNSEWVEYVKTSEGISELTDEHQKVIDALQEYYKKNGIAPMVRILSKDHRFPAQAHLRIVPLRTG
jgi:TusE/DsrC/DsvC family sulfur relay protein